MARLRLDLHSVAAMASNGVMVSWSRASLGEKAGGGFAALLQAAAL
jgi:hypothetical protein